MDTSISMSHRSMDLSPSPSHSMDVHPSTLSSLSIPPSVSSSPSHDSFSGPVPPTPSPVPLSVTALSHLYAYLHSTVHLFDLLSGLSAPPGSTAAIASIPGELSENGQILTSTQRIQRQEQRMEQHRLALKQALIEMKDRQDKQQQPPASSTDMAPEVCATLNQLNREKQELLQQLSVGQSKLLSLTSSLQDLHRILSASSPSIGTDAPICQPVPPQAAIQEAMKVVRSTTRRSHT